MTDFYYKDGEESEVHSSDAYFKNPILRNNNFVIPYINLGISNHPVNTGLSLKFLSYAYLVAIDVTFLSTWIPDSIGFNGRQFWVINRLKTDSVNYWGGCNLDKNSIFSSLEICCKSVLLSIPSYSKLSDTIWLPIESDSTKVMMDSKINEDFFNGVLMTEEVKKLIE